MVLELSEKESDLIRTRIKKQCDYLRHRISELKSGYQLPLVDNKTLKVQEQIERKEGVLSTYVGILEKLN